MMGYLGLTITEQTLVFLYSLLLGVLLCAIYDVFRIIRIAFGGKTITVFIEDIVFSIIALVLTFVFVIAFNNGELRFFVLIGEFLGFVFYYFTVGKLTMFFSKAIIKLIKRLISIVCTPFVGLFGMLKKKFRTKKEKRGQKRAHIFKNPLKIDK